MKRSDSESGWLGLSEGLMSFLDTVGRFLLFGGGLVFAGSVGFLFFTYMNGAGASAQAVTGNLNTFGPFAVIGGIALSAGAMWLYWGEEVLGPSLLIVAAALIFSPVYLPMMSQAGGGTEGGRIVQAIQNPGIAVGILGLIAILVDLMQRLKARVRQGARADQLKYGKGIKEEKDIRNIFMGKCWQLPYCRKFVRERCPIYHSRRTCWKERVGCMCEESVIRNAMEGKVIPKDMVAASKFIPYNTKLSPEMKFERCKQCTIYNEHQKHKYQLAVPSIIVGVIGLWWVLRVPMGGIVQGWLANAGNVFSRATFADSQGRGGNLVSTAPNFLGIGVHEILVGGFCFLLFAYGLRLAEHVFFKLKL